MTGSKSYRVTDSHRTSNVITMEVLALDSEEARRIAYPSFLAATPCARKDITDLRVDLVDSLI